MALTAAAAIALAPIGVAIAESVGGVIDTGAAASDAPVPAGSTGINDPKLLACTRQKNVCNPAATAEIRAVPWVSPLPAGASIMSQGAAESLTRAAAGAPGNAPTSSRLVTGAQAVAGFGIDRSTNVDESRPVWVVTVRADVLTDGGPAQAPVKKTSYSAIVDAGSGEITDDCIGCAWQATSG
jgi:hypothetical protein